MTDVFDRLACGTVSEKFAAMRAFDSHPHRNFVLCSDDVFDVDFDVGKGSEEYLSMISPGIMPTLLVRHIRDVDNEIRPHQAEASIDVLCI
jgi:hypothetical protein